MKTSIYICWASRCDDQGPQDDAPRLRAGGPGLDDLGTRVGWHSPPAALPDADLSEVLGEQQDVDRPGIILCTAACVQVRGTGHRDSRKNRGKIPGCALCAYEYQLSDGLCGQGDPGLQTTEHSLKEDTDKKAGQKPLCHPGEDTKGHTSQ